MYSNDDLERFYFQYQTEAVPSGESVQSFCKRNNVPYNIFSKWYKDTRQKIVEVSVDGLPSADSCPSSRSPEVTPPKSQGTLRIMVDIAMSNGLRLSQKNLSYRELLRRETVLRSPIITVRLCQVIRKTVISVT